MKAPDSLIQPCRDARTSCVFYEHTAYGILEVSGVDRVQFLNNLLSNDVKNLTSGKALPACLLDPQAKVIAYMHAFGLENSLRLVLDAEAKNRALEHLKKLIIMEDIEIRERTEEFKIFSVHGPKAKEVVEKIGNNRVAFLVNQIGEVGFQFFVPTSSAEKFRDVLLKLGAPLIHHDAFETLRIEAGIPRYGVDFDETSIPLEVHLDHAVSFSKGCFPGQEIVARLDSRGGVSKKLCGLVFKEDETPNRRDEIQKDGKEVGRITSATYSPTLNKVIALGMLKKEFWEENTEVTVMIAGKTISACVTALPFVPAKTA